MKQTSPDDAMIRFIDTEEMVKGVLLHCERKKQKKIMHHIQLQQRKNRSTIDDAD